MHTNNRWRKRDETEKNDPAQIAGTGSSEKCSEIKTAMKSNSIAPNVLECTKMNGDRHNDGKYGYWIPAHLHCNICSNLKFHRCN